MDNKRGGWYISVLYDSFSSLVTIETDAVRKAIVKWKNLGSQIEISS